MGTAVALAMGVGSRFVFKLKGAVAAVITMDAIGTLLGWFFQDRIPNRGYRFFTDSDSITPWARAAIFWGIYESAEIRFVKKYLRRDLDVIELGSSIGVVSCHIRGKLSRDSRLVCVEANPTLLGIIQRNLDSNHPGARYSIVNAAIHRSESQSRTVTLQLGANNTSSFVSAKPNHTSIEVAAASLEELVASCCLEEFALICDIEGSETAFILGDGAPLAGCRQIIIELHDSEIDGHHYSVQELRDILVGRHGFSQIAVYGPVLVLER